MKGNVEVTNGQHYAMIDGKDTYVTWSNYILNGPFSANQQDSFFKVPNN